MPARYLAIKEHLKKKGISEDQAQEQAAKIYNASRKKGEPVVGGRKKGDKLD